MQSAKQPKGVSTGVYNYTKVEIHVLYNYNRTY